jgi:hypothetical protein
MKYLLISTKDLEVIQKVKDLISEEDANVLCISDSIEEAFVILKMINAINASEHMPIVVIGGHDTTQPKNAAEALMNTSKINPEIFERPKMDFELTPTPDLGIESYSSMKIDIREPSKQNHKEKYKYHK